jgi:hypothetical protein
VVRKLLSSDAILLYVHKTAKKPNICQDRLARDKHQEELWGKDTTLICFCRDGVRFKTPKGEMIVSDLAFDDLEFERVGLHYPNTSGWPGAGISCDNAANVSYSK